MLHHIVIVYGLGAVFLWLVVAPKSMAVALAAGIPSVAAVLVLAWLVRRRARRLRSEWEGIAPRLITHGGPGGSRWDRRRADRAQPEDFEAHVGGGW